MLNVGLFEDARYRDLLPLVWLRPCWELRLGRDRLIDKLRTHVGPRIQRVWPREALRERCAAEIELAAPSGDDWALVNARALVTADLELPAPGDAWVRDGEVLALTLSAADVERLPPEPFLDDARLLRLAQRCRSLEPPTGVRLIRWPWELALLNAAELRRQLPLDAAIEGTIYPGAHLLNPAAIHVAAGAVIKPGVVLDAENGPILIEAGAMIQPNAVIEGPCCIGAKSIVRPGAVIREGTTIGPVCKVGGEVEASILFGHSNKQHDGFLGHSYVGEWVNLGADTVTSDLKNTYGRIRVCINGGEVDSGEQFVGSLIGDHAKTGIGTILPTGCVLGAFANVFTRSAVPKFVPSFAWLTDDGLTDFRMEKAVAIAQTVMSRRGVALTEADERLIRSAAAAARQIESSGWLP